MPRNGGGVYSLPGGSAISNGDTSDASDLNAPLDDIETDLNTARPIVAGGTGATSAAAARVNLEVLLSEQTAYSNDLDDLSETGLYPLTTGASNHWTTAANGDFVLYMRHDANTGFQLGFDGDGTMFRRREASGSWSDWAPYLNQNQVIGNDTDDLDQTQALKLIAYGCVTDGTSGGFTVAYDEGCTVTRDSTGIYDVSFDNTRSAATYMVSPEPRDNNRVYCNTFTTGGFKVVSRDPSNNLDDANGGFSFRVFEKRT